MRYILKHSGVYSGKKTPTFYMLFLIQGNLWAGELWDLCHCAQKRHCQKEQLFLLFFNFILVWSSSRVLACFEALSIPVLLTHLLLTWGNWASSLAFWPALILPCHSARRCSLLSGAVAQQPQRVLALCGPHSITLLTIAALQALRGAACSACALCYHHCLQPTPLFSWWW